MKKHLLYLCCMVLAVTACQKTKPDANDINPIPEPVVKKYLVKEYDAGHLDTPIMVIEWNDDFSQIRHISTYQNTYFQLDFSFEYYGNDSMRVVLSWPDYSLPLARFSDYTCHFDEFGRISSVYYYINSEYQQSEKYNYNSSGKLESIIDEEHDCGTRFVWDGDNVTEMYGLYSDEPFYSYSGFTDKFHQYYTIPYVLQRGDGYHSHYLTQPFWKNVYTQNTQQIYCEFDEDGYITLGCHINSDGDTIPERCYEYIK